MYLQFTNYLKKIINKEINNAITRYGNEKTDFRKIREKTIEWILLTTPCIEEELYLMAKEIINEEIKTNDNNAKN